MQKVVQFKTKGMQRDLSASAFNSGYSYENKNVRVMPTDESTLLSLINEKGNKKSDIAGVGDHIKGIPIGQALVNNELIIFAAGDDDYRLADITPNIFEAPDIFPCDVLITDLTAGEDTANDITPDLSSIGDITFVDCPYKLNIDVDSMLDDRIYKLWFNNGVLTGKRLFRGNLGFNYKYPIETIPFYENNDIRKVYWTDGKNQPRIINIAAKESIINKWNKNSFDFVQRLKLNENITITRNVVASGSFAPGVIQYAFTYFNKYGQESNIFYTSPLYYVSYNNRGASPEDKVSNSFNIRIDKVDNSFDYVRVYSIHRTSINATPEVRRVADLAPYLNSETNKYEVAYVDTGLSGDSVDPTELLYVGGEEVVFGTMTQKDNTLFLGNIEVKRRHLDTTIRDYFKGKNITFSSYFKSLNPSEAKGYYPYENQLKLNSYQFKTFKYLEWYRFGIQAQHYTGKWSEPIWINDVRNTTPIDTPFYNNNTIGLPVAEFTLNDSTIINKLLDNGYIRIRPVVVYPTINDREVICQGILCPTVYNVSDRYSNTPFVQSSWFVRPNVPFDIGNSLSTDHQYANGRRGDWRPLSNPTIENEVDLYSRAGILYNGPSTQEERDNDIKNNIDIVNKGVRLEFRHNKPIPSNEQRNAEIQCIYNPPESPFVDNKTNDNNVTALNWVNDNGENYYIDQSILTFHSPDIEFDTEVRSLDTSNLQLRIVGMVPITSFVGDIDIQTSTPVNNFKGSDETPRGFYKEPIGVQNSFSHTENDGKLVFVEDSHFGYRSLSAGVFWLDEITGLKPNNSEKSSTGFVVYPWHRNGSLNNTKFAKDGYRSAMLDKKKLSNMRYSYKPYYFSATKIWNAYENDNITKTGISGVSIFDSDEISLVKLPAPKYSDLSELNYYGNVDKLLTITRVGDKKDGYPIITTGAATILDNGNELADDSTSIHRTFSHNVWKKLFSPFTAQSEGVDPVRIKYKSTPHAVLALNYTKEGAQRILPTIQDNLSAINKGSTSNSSQHFFWSKTTNSVSQDVIDSPLGPVPDVPTFQYGWLWLGELYNPNVTNRFGGQTEESFENNVWLPCGDPISLIDINNGVKSSVTIRWKEGDTYFQRYDHIKTYPFTLEDQNAVTDIISFMCETHVNLDGRYDRNRGQLSNFAITPANFNLINDVYTQPNNFFNYRTINPNKLNLDNFHNSITWTKTKTAGELVDTWTNITLASTLDLDGDKGTVRALRRFNNNVLAFQDRGISQILYNENMQISSTDGVPIEIANSGKVNGKRYISDGIGCTNKWSICETSNGIYFIDDITKGIFLFNGQLDNLSDRLGFHSWINRASDNIDIWNPVDFDGFVTYYDKVNGDVFFISKDECLAFSEPLGQFSSFYSYEKMPYFINLEDRGIAFNVEGTGTLYRPWLHNEGDYNMFFGVYQPFYTTVIANPDMPVDKIFNNLEFRSDSWDKNGNLLNTTFDTLTVWDEYQQGTSTLSDILGRPSNLKKKFRIWRANIPRAKANGRDRMRNPWLYIKLSMEEENVNKTVLHDMIVHYFE